LDLVVGAGGFVGRHVAAALQGRTDVRLLAAEKPSEPELEAALDGIEVVYFAAETWAPWSRLYFRREPHPVIVRTLKVARRAGVRRLVHLSTADVFGPDQNLRLTESSPLKPVHAYERLKLREEQWLRESAGELELVILRPARLFGTHDDFLTPTLLRELQAGRLWLVAGGRVQQTFVAGPDLGRAFVAAGERGQAGATYLVGGFDSSWREFLEACSQALQTPARVIGIPYDVAYVLAGVREWLTPYRARSWPGLFGVDLFGRPRLYDDSRSRRRLTWSPQVGSFDQVAGELAAFYGRRRQSERLPAATSPPGR